MANVLKIADLQARVSMLRGCEHAAARGSLDSATRIARQVATGLVQKMSFQLVDVTAGKGATRCVRNSHVWRLAHTRSGACAGCGACRRRRQCGAPQASHATMLTFTAEMQSCLQVTR